jgi:hypothetical protein
MFNSSRISCSFNAVSVDFDGDKKPFQRNLKARTVDADDGRVPSLVLGGPPAALTTL